MQGNSILIVEDEAVVAMDIKKTLKSLGYHVPCIAFSGEQAVEMARREKPGLVLMDILLRGKMDGIQAAEEIRKDLSIPVIYLTAYADKEKLQRAKATQPFGYILKPFESRELHAAIEIALCKHRAEERLKESEKFSSSLLENSPNPVMVINPDTSVRYVNTALEAITGYTSGELIGVKAPYPWRIKDSKSYDYEYMKRVVEQGEETTERLFRSKEGREFWVEEGFTPVKERETVEYCLSIWVDVTQKKQAARELCIKGSAIECSINAICLADMDGKVTYVNPSFLRLWGFGEKSEVLGRNAAGFWVDRGGASRIIKKLQEKGSWVGELKGKRKDGEGFDLQVSFSLVKYPDGKPLCMMASFMDITERKRAEDKIKNSLKEKEVLLKEVHHRVKNNMQVVSSLLNLQSGYIKDGQALEMLIETMNRVRSMAIVHEQLYQSGDMVNIELTEYVKKLTSDLFHSYGVDPNTISLELDVGNIMLDINTAIPCGLIINELISNSLKHAFPDGRKGKIRISLQEEVSNEFCLAVNDDGIGFPEGLDFRNTETMGMELVTTLVGQLEGRIELERNGGTRFSVRFRREA